MKSFTVCLSVSAEKYVTVSAESEEEAKHLAEQSEDNDFSLCNYCSKSCELSDITGQAISAEEVDDV